VSLLGWALLATSLAGTQAETPSVWHLDLQALTDVPIDVGARVRVEGPYRIRLSTSLGILPGPYVDLINAFVEGVGGYNQQTGDLISQSLQTSLVWRTHLGWRPFEAHGFNFAVGYGLVTLGGGASAPSAIATLLGTNPPAFSGQSYSVSSVISMIDAEVGWQWLWLDDRVVIDADVGFAGTLAASSSVENQNPNPLTPRADANFDTATANYLDKTYTSYVFAPVITIAAGYRFF
jgi:hypothetical protein